MAHNKIEKDIRKEEWNIGYTNTDIVKKCIDCGNNFTVALGEQKFLVAKGYKFPKRCRNCRKKAKDPRFYGLRKTMNTSKVTKSSTKGRDISRTSGDFKHIDSAFSPVIFSERFFQELQEFEREMITYAVNQETI